MLRQDSHVTFPHEARLMINAKTAARLSIAAMVGMMTVSSIVVASEEKTGPRSGNRQSLFVITDQEGYGTGDCLSKTGGCGKIIADSFCESQGFKAAEYYRLADPDDITGSIASERKPTARQPQAFVISCK